MSSIILEAKSLTKEYKQTLALDHINLQIKKGKIADTLFTCILQSNHI